MIKILIVDDDKAVGAVLEVFLNPYGPCHIAEDGTTAYDMFCQALKDGTPYDVIFLDIMMPSMNGLTVLKFVRETEGKSGIERDKQVKIIIISTREDAETIDKAKELGCDAYLVKTEVREKLLDTLASLGLIDSAD